MRKSIPDGKKIRSITVIGRGLELRVEYAFHASSAKKVCRTKHCLVLTGEVLSGKVIADEEVTLIINGEIKQSTIVDTIVRIEKNKSPLKYGVPGDRVGICLKHTKFKQLC